MKNDTWRIKLDKVVYKIEGLAHAFISELQDLKHFIQDEESLIKDKIHEWKEHIEHFPTELRERI
jgi:hypothetical protein